MFADHGKTPARTHYKTRPFRQPRFVILDEKYLRAGNLPNHFFYSFNVGWEISLQPSRYVCESSVCKLVEGWMKSVKKNRNSWHFQVTNPVLFAAIDSWWYPRHSVHTWWGDWMRNLGTSTAIDCLKSNTTVGRDHEVSESPICAGIKTNNENKI